MEIANKDLKNYFMGVSILILVFSLFNILFINRSFKEQDEHLRIMLGYINEDKPYTLVLTKEFNSMDCMEGYMGSKFYNEIEYTMARKVNCSEYSKITIEDN